MPRRRLFALLFALPVLLGGRADLDGQAGQPRVAIDREYRLEATMLGYRGIGGTIAGIRNPTLWARTGETVRITIVNGEVMVHDIALEKQPVKSRQILERGETASITFKAEQSDTYFCSLPGHRISGMEGRLDVSDEPRTTSDEGTAPTAGQRSLNLDFEAGSLSDWTATGDAFSVVKAAGRSPELRDAPDDRAGDYWVSSRPGGSPKRGVLTSAPFPVTHPYASFLRLRGRVPNDARRDRPGRGRSAALHDVRVRRRQPASRGRGSPGAGQQAHRDPPRGRRDRRADRVVPGGEPLGAHRVRPVPLSRRAAVLPGRGHAVREPRAAAARDRAPCRPVGRRGGARDDRARRVHGDAGRRRARRRPSDRLRDGRPRPPVGGGGARLPAEGPRGRRPRSHPDLRGHQRRRPARPAQGVHRQPESRQRPRGRVRRGLGRRRAAPAVHPEEGGRRSAVRSAAGAARRMGLRGHARDAEHLSLGTGWLAVRHPRRVHATRRSASRAPPTPTARRSMAGSGAITRPGTSSNDSPRARAIPGASTSTTTATPSRPPASSSTCITSSRADGTSGRRTSTSISTPTTTSRPSPIIATGWARRGRTPPTAAPARPGAAMPTPAR